MVGAGFVLGAAAAVIDTSRKACNAPWLTLKPPAFNSSMSCAHGGAVAAIRLEQGAFEIRADLDIHRRADRGGHAVGAIVGGREAAVQDVVLVSGHNEPVDGQAHALGQVAREDVAENCRWGTVKLTGRAGAPSDTAEVK